MEIKDGVSVRDWREERGKKKGEATLFDDAASSRDFHTESNRDESGIYILLLKIINRAMEHHHSHSVSNDS